MRGQIFKIIAVAFLFFNFYEISNAENSPIFSQKFSVENENIFLPTREKFYAFAVEIPENCEVFARDEFSDFRKIFSEDDEKISELFFVQNSKSNFKFENEKQNLISENFEKKQNVILEISEGNYPESPNFEIQKNENLRYDLKFQN